MPVRVMHMLGAEILILTNAAGGMNPSYKPGTLVRITDQITSFVPSPLIGANMEALGTRFPDMSHVYDVELGKKLDSVAKTQGITLEEGIYLQATGPNYETPAEIRMYRTLGADLVGMSTACEAMAARHAAKAVNIALMGRLSKYFPEIPEAAWEEAIDAIVAEKFRALNHKAFEFGRNA